MSIDESRNRKIGAILQFAQIFVSIIVSIIYTPFMLHTLGQNTYGVYSTCSSTIAYLSLLSLGFGSSYMRYYTRATKMMDGVTIEELNWQYLLVFISFGLIALTLGIVLSINSKILFNSTFSNEDIVLSRKLMFILSFNMAISFPASVFSSYISSQQDFIFLKSVNILKTVASPTLSFFMLISGYGSVGMVIASTCVNFFADIVNIYFSIFKLHMRFKICALKGYLIKKIAAFSIFIGINQIVNQLNFSADKIVLSKVADAASVAIYSVGATLNTYFEQIGSSIANLFDPKINKIVVNSKNENEKKKELDDIFIRVGRIQYIILSLILTGFCFYGSFFISWWAGDNYKESYYITIFLMFPMLIPLVQNTAVYIQRAKNKHQFRSILYLITSTINVFISILLAKYYGAIGAALGTTVTLLINAVIINIFYYKIIELDVLQFWKELIFMTKGLVAPVIFGIFTSKYVYNIKYFFIFVIVYSIIYFISMYFMAFNRYEKDIIKNILIRIKLIKR